MWLQKIRKRQQILRPVLALEHLALFGDAVQAPQVEHGRQHLAHAQALVHAPFPPGAELIRLDDVAGVEAVLQPSATRADGRQHVGSGRLNRWRPKRQFGVWASMLHIDTRSAIQ